MADTYFYFVCGYLGFLTIGFVGLASLFCKIRRLEKRLDS